MSTMTYKPVVTIQDLFDAGACQRGVRRFLTEGGGQIVCRAADFPDVEWIQRAANNGHGFGYGEGYGHGHGYSDGHAYSEGYEYGSDGDTYGDEGDAGYGAECGDGDGCGDFFNPHRTCWTPDKSDEAP